MIISTHRGFIDDRKIIIPDETQFFFYVKDGDILEDSYIDGIIIERKHLEKNTAGQEIRDYLLNPYEEEEVYAVESMKYTKEFKKVICHNYEVHIKSLGRIYNKEADSLKKNLSTSLEEKNFKLVKVLSNFRLIQKMEENNSDILILEKTSLGELFESFAAIRLSETMKLLKKENYPRQKHML